MTAVEKMEEIRKIILGRTPYDNRKVHVTFSSDVSPYDFFSKLDPEVESQKTIEMILKVINDQQN